MASQSSQLRKEEKAFTIFIRMAFFYFLQNCQGSISPTTEKLQFYFTIIWHKNFTVNFSPILGAVTPNAVTTKNFFLHKSSFALVVIMLIKMTYFTYSIGNGALAVFGGVTLDAWKSLRNRCLQQLLSGKLKLLLSISISISISLLK